MASLVRALARPLLAGIYVMGGYYSFTQPAGHAQQTEPVVGKVAERVGGVDSEQLVKLDGAVKMVAGTLLAIGRLPRLSALALAGSLVATTVAGHRFWEENDPEARGMQRTQFVKNLSLLGGLLLAATDAGPRPRHTDAD